MSPIAQVHLFAPAFCSGSLAALLFDLIRYLTVTESTSSLFPTSARRSSIVSIALVTPCIVTIVFRDLFWAQDAAINVQSMRPPIMCFLDSGSFDHVTLEFATTRTLLLIFSRRELSTLNFFTHTNSKINIASLTSLSSNNLHFNFNRALQLH